jgi:hypothetical protein
MSNLNRFEILKDEAKKPPYITFTEGEPVLVIPLEELGPYQQNNRDVTRYRGRVAQLSQTGKLELRLMTLPETAARYFGLAAEHGGYVAVTMTDTEQGKRYWSNPLDEPLSEEEREFVEKHRVIAGTK